MYEFWKWTLQTDIKHTAEIYIEDQTIEVDIIHWLDNPKWWACTFIQKTNKEPTPEDYKLTGDSKNPMLAMRELMNVTTDFITKIQPDLFTWHPYIEGNLKFYTNYGTRQIERLSGYESVIAYTNEESMTGFIPPQHIAVEIRKII